MSQPAPPHIPRGRAAMIVVGALAATGVVIGALWAWLAPAVHGVVALTKGGDRVRAHLGNEADHFFVAAFLMVGMLCVLAVVAAVLVWQWRAHRGPLMVAALGLGSAAAAGVAAGVGAALVHWRYGTIDVDAAPISAEHRVHYVDRGAFGVLRALAIADRLDDPVSRGHHSAGLLTHRGGDRT